MKSPWTRRDSDWKRLSSSFGQHESKKITPTFIPCPIPHMTHIGLLYLRLLHNRTERAQRFARKRWRPISAACSAERLLVCGLILLSDTACSTSSVCHSCLSFTHILNYVQVYDLIFSDLGPLVVARICYNFTVMRATWLF